MQKICLVSCPISPRNVRSTDRLIPHTGVSVLKSDVHSANKFKTGTVNPTRVSLMFTLVAAAILAFGVPAANAANYYYASNSMTRENSGHDSGVRSVITGGSARADGLNAEGAQPTVTIKTYHPAPGYKEIARSTGGSGANLTHSRATRVHSACSWTWSFGSGSIGSLPMTCSARS